MEPPATQYTKSGDVTIAYQEWGAGLPTVWVPDFISQKDLALGSSLTFVPAGQRTYKGVPGEFAVFTVA